MAMLKGKVESKYFAYAFATICTFVILVVSYISLSNRFLWFDEAGQLWISLGLNHFSAPFSPRGTLLDVLQNNSFYNMDPGGFSVLLSLWSLVSTNIIFVRTFPFLLFLGFCILLSIITKNETKSTFLSIFVFTLPFVLPYLTNKVAEVRGYGMEEFGVFISVYLLMRIKQKTTYTRILMLGIVLAFFCTSRYSFILFSLAISFRLFTILLQEGTDKRRVLAYTTLYAIPLIVMVGLIYFYMMSVQNGGAKKLHYGGYILSEPQLLISPMSFLFYANIIYLVYLSKNKKRIPEIMLVAVLVGIVFFVASCADKYPWSTIRTMPVFALLVFSLCISFFVNTNIKIGPMRLALTLTTLSLFAFWITFYKELHKAEVQANEEMEEFIDYIDKAPKQKYYVVSYYNPMIRCYFEMGQGNKDNAFYPEKLYLQKAKKFAFSINDRYKDKGPDEVEADIYFMPQDWPVKKRKDYTLLEGRKFLYTRLSN